MGGIFSKPKMPQQKPPVRMPLPEDARSRAEKERRLRELQTVYRGREATELSNDYSGTVLGT